MSNDLAAIIIGVVMGLAVSVPVALLIVLLLRMRQSRGH